MNPSQQRHLEVVPRLRGSAHRGMIGEPMSSKFDLARAVAEAEPGSEGFAHALNLLVLAIRRTNPSVGPLLVYTFLGSSRRLSVGLEDRETLWADLANALANA